MRPTVASIVAGFFFAAILPNAGLAETYKCSLPKGFNYTTRTPTELFAQIDTDESIVVVTDNIPARSSNLPVAATISKDDGNRVIFHWEVSGLSGAGGYEAGSYTIGIARYRAAIKRNTNEIRLSIYLNRYGQPPVLSKGRCERVS